MTQIGPYGMGAGRIVSAAADDEDDRGRERRVTASRSAERARKSAEMREQLAQAQRAAALSEARQRQTQQEHAATGRRERQGEAVAKAAESRAAGVKALPLNVPPQKALETRDGEPKSLEQGPTACDEALVPPSVGESLRSSDTLPAETPDFLMARLLEDLPQWRAQRFLVDAEQRFDSLRQSIAQAKTSPSPDARERLEALAGSLEFVQGYLEAGTEAGGAGQRLLMIIDGIRQEVAGMLSVFERPQAGGALATAAAGVAGSEALRSQATVAARRSARSESVEYGKLGSKDREEEEGARSTAAGVLLAATVMPVEAPRASSPSLERDLEKRKGETPVSVAVKSI